MCSGLWSQATSYPLPFAPALLCSVCFKFYLFIYFWLCWLFPAAQAVVPGLLTAVAAFVVDAGPRALGLQPCSSLALGHRLSSWVHRLRCSTACGIFPHQGSNPCLLQWQVYSLALSYQGSPPALFWGYFLKSRSYIYKLQKSVLRACLCACVRMCRHTLSSLLPPSLPTLSLHPLSNHSY